MLGARTSKDRIRCKSSKSTTRPLSPRRPLSLRPSRRCRSRSASQGRKRSGGCPRVASAEAQPGLRELCREPRVGRQERPALAILPWKPCARRCPRRRPCGATARPPRRRTLGWRPRFVDKILKDAKPGDLPVEITTKFELSINPKAPDALGLAVPPMLFARAAVMTELDFRGGPPACSGSPPSAAGTDGTSATVASRPILDVQRSQTSRRSQVVEPKSGVGPVIGWAHPCLKPVRAKRRRCLRVSDSDLIDQRLYRGFVALDASGLQPGRQFLNPSRAESAGVC